MSGTRWTGKPLLGNVRLVDPKIISGAQEWLIRKQKADGSWMEIDGLFEGWHGGTAPTSCKTQGNKGF